MEEFPNSVFVIAVLVRAVCKVYVENSRIHRPYPYILYMDGEDSSIWMAKKRNFW